MFQRANNTVAIDACMVKVKLILNIVFIKQKVLGMTLNSSVVVKSKTVSGGKSPDGNKGVKIF